MHLSFKEIWTAAHGMVLGAAFLLLFSGVMVAVRNYRTEWLRPEGATRLHRALIAGTWILAVMAWFAVITGTYVIYPWYRAKPPGSPPYAASAELSNYPKYLLLSKPGTHEWHEFGMEWKEHIAWFSPILATGSAVIISRNGKQLLLEARLRQAVMALLGMAFFCAAVAGGLGALINKVAPTR